MRIFILITFLCFTNNFLIGQIENPLKDCGADDRVPFNHLANGFF